ncbi:hypothetical protein [Anaerococcus vaginalis]|uniref:hypothetical protein n=1 Tax=Anaerococcus vaginalis TaxID=33037 RepID=UPI00290D3987|nr:hypothetical protein [Anaerococcus vaginalis]MDU5560668.1 hypothetical protein [Anaerococcus vaginalis]
MSDISDLSVELNFTAKELEEIMSQLQQASELIKVYKTEIMGKIDQSSTGDAVRDRFNNAEGEIKLAIRYAQQASDRVFFLSKELLEN